MHRFRPVGLSLRRARSACKHYEPWPTLSVWPLTLVSNANKPQKRPHISKILHYLRSWGVQTPLVRFLLAPLEIPKLANAQPSNFGPLRALRPFLGTFQVSIYPGTGKITILTLLVLSLALFTSDLVIWTTFRLLTLSWLLLLDIELDARPVMQCFDYVFINGQWMYYLPSLKASKKIGFGPCVRPTCPSDLVR